MAFIYPDEKIAAVNQLVVPAGVPIEFALTSATVMNAFFVPQLGSMIYTMPGMTTRLNLLAERPGDYPGLSSQFSGDGFSDMRFLVHAVSASEFESWLARTRGEGPALNADAYSQLARPGTNTKVQTYGSVDPNLFELRPTPRQEGIELVHADRVRDREMDDLRMGTESFALQISVRDHDGPHDPVIHECEIVQARAGGHTERRHRPDEGRGREAEDPVVRADQRARAEEADPGDHAPEEGKRILVL